MTSTASFDFHTSASRRIVCLMRSRRRQLAAGALLVAVLAGEVAGRWLVAHLPLVGHVPQRGHGGLDAWPVVVVAAKIGIALLLARLAWRLVRAHQMAVAGERLLRIRRFRPTRPLPAVGLSPRAWLASFAAMSILYLVPTSSGEVTNGCWLLVTPWLHTQALPVFAVLAVVVAALWRTLSRWLAALERYGERLQRLCRSGREPLSVRRWTSAVSRAPRSLFGLAFESRPPPALA